MTKTVKRNVVVSAILAIMLCISLIAGATFALFTSQSKVNIAVTSGKVSVIANIDETSVETKQLNTDYTQGADNMYEGEATFADNGLTLKKFVSGDGIKFNIVVKNESNVTVKYRTIITCENDDGLFEGLVISLGKSYDGATVTSKWTQLAVGSEDAVVPVTIELPEDAGNDYQDKTCTVSYMVEAVQGNAVTIDKVVEIASIDDFNNNFNDKADKKLVLTSDLVINADNNGSGSGIYSEADGYTKFNTIIDLNGYDIKVDDAVATGEALFTTWSSFVLTSSVEGSEIVLGDNKLISAKGSVEISNVKITRNNTENSTGKANLIDVISGELVISNCTFDVYMQRTSMFITGNAATNVAFEGENVFNIKFKLSGFGGEGFINPVKNEVSFSGCEFNIVDTDGNAYEIVKKDSSTSGCWRYVFTKVNA